jgi:hypothetical protein
MNGLDLRTMPANDMVDVLHYLFEDDLSASTAEQAEARSKARVSIYRDLYGREYKYVIDTGMGESHPDYNSAEYGASEESQEAAIEPFNPVRQPVKPFISATPVNAASSKPFGKVLDEPMGH